MPTVLDTAHHPVGDRAEVVLETLRQAWGGAKVTLNVPAPEARSRVDVWSLGGGLSLMRREGSPVGLERAGRRADGPEKLTLTVVSPGHWSYDQDGHAVEGALGWTAVLVDHTQPFRSIGRDEAQTYALSLDSEILGLERELVRTAARQLPTSPLHGLVLDHVVALAKGSAGVPAGPASTMLGTAALELLRALVISAADDEGRTPQISADVLLDRTRTYIRRHYADPALSPPQIARAHAVSLRRLYQVWSETEQSMAEFVMRTRLEAARDRIAERSPRPPAISAVARECGFVDNTHFSRRFRQAFGLSPREWRQLAFRAPDE